MMSSHHGHQNASEIQLDQFDISYSVYVGAYFAQNNENITSVSLPKNVTMGRASFINCANLSIVQYAGTVEEWNTLYSSGKIGANTFANTQVTEIICNGGATPVNVSFTSPNALIIDNMENGSYEPFSLLSICIISIMTRHIGGSFAMNKKRFYFTTPIYYPSAKLHIGHAYCTTLTDILVRNKRLRGYETYFLTGADEHGQKIEKNAASAGKTPQKFVDDIVEGFYKLWELLHISNDDFIRTTQDRHVKVVQDIFSKMLKQDDIYLGKYKGWYCTPCESFWTDTQVGPDHICPDCGRPVQLAEEESYFFKTGKYVDSLLKFFEENPKFLTPESRKNEMINTFIKPGLDDLCVSRTSFSWGIQIKENPKHVIYVWLDALTNYITALGYGSDNEALFKKFWEDEDCEIVHILGADITRFHAIYWPMFLESLGIRKPDREFVHGLLMMRDSKMSKSKGNVVDPFPLVERYGVDAVRYYLAREVTFGQDGSFTPEQFVERVNMDLANSLGNLLNRTVSMINKYFGGEIPAYQGKKTNFDGELETLISLCIKKYEDNFDDLKVTEAITSAMDIVSRANKYIDETTPWALAKDEAKKEELASVMNHLATALFVSGMLLKPVLVTASDKLFAQLGLNPEEVKYEDINRFDFLGGQMVNKGEQLFPRLDNEVEVAFIQELMGGNK